MDPPPYDERNAMAWLVLFMTHVATYKAAAVIETAELCRGGTIFDHTDPNLRRKLAKRLGMDQHPDDVKVVQDAVAAAAEAPAERTNSFRTAVLGKIIGIGRQR
jgi:hypothetical protein